MRLNGWQRIGIVASVVWVATSYITSMNASMKSAGDLSYLDYKICTEEKARKKESFAPCTKLSSETFRRSMEESRRNAIATAVLPIPLGWLLAYIVIWIVRWIRAGFSKA